MSKGVKKFFCEETKELIHPGARSIDDWTADLAVEGEGSEIGADTALMVVEEAEESTGSDDANYRGNDKLPAAMDPVDAETRIRHL